jgi:hypothetical protein
MTAIHKKLRWNLVLKNKWFSSIFIYLPLFGFYTTSAFADDQLLGALDDIKANFGLTSVFIKVLYLMEIYYGWRKYRETHNPLAVGSIVLVAMAFTYAIGKWVGK